MDVSARVNHLQNQHDELSRKIEEVQRAPSVDALELTALKRKKLKLKDEIKRLSG